MIYQINVEDLLSSNIYKHSCPFCASLLTDNRLKGGPFNCFSKKTSTMCVFATVRGMVCQALYASSRSAYSTLHLQKFDVGSVIITLLLAKKIPKTFWPEQ